MLQMDSSDEELFEVTPSNSVTKTNQINESKKWPTTPLKDISVQLTRLRLDVELKDKQISTSCKNKKVIPSRWKDGLISKKKFNKRRSEKLRSQEKGKTIGTISLETLVDKADTHLKKQHIREARKESHADTRQNLPIPRMISSSSSICEVQDKEKELYSDESCMSARTLPYNWTMKKVTSNKATALKTHCILHSNNSKEREHLSDGKILKCRHPILVDTTKLIRRHNDRTRHDKSINMTRSVSMESKKNEFVQKEITSDSDSSYEIPIVKKKRIKIFSDSSDESIKITSIKSATISNINNKNSCHSSPEKMDKKDMQSRVVLTRLEEMRNPSAAKWQERIAKDASQNTDSRQQVEEQQSRVICTDKEESGRKNSPEKKQHEDDTGLNQHSNPHSTSNAQTNHQDERDESNMMKDGAFSITKNISKDSQSVSTECTARMEKRSQTKEKKVKYKLFRKPRVLMIKLESLQPPSKNGKYLSDVVDCLTHKYMFSVMKSDCMSSVSTRSLYEFVRSHKEIKVANLSTREDTSQIVQTEKDDVVSKRTIDENLSPCSTIEKSSTEGNKNS